MKPCLIDNALSQKISNFSLLCACCVPFFHVNCMLPYGTSAWWCLFMARSWCAFAVPAFFTISGFLLVGNYGSDLWWRNAVRKRLVTLGIPYLFWNVMAWLFLLGLSCIASWLGMRYGGFAMLGGGGGGLAILGLDPFRPPALQYYWYIRAVAVLILLAPIFVMIKGRGVVILGIGMLAWEFCPRSDIADYFFEWNLPVYGFFYFSLGVWLRFNGKWLNYNKSLGWGLLLIGLTLTAISGWCGVRFGSSHVRIASGIKSLASLVTLCGIWGSLPSIAIPRKVTSFSFPIYTLHWFVGYIVSIFLAFIGMRELTEQSFGGYLLRVILLIVASVGIASSFRKLLPANYAKVFGGR